MPTTINTVLGDLKPEDLGFTLGHEHLCIASPGFWQAWPEFFGGRESYIERTVEKLQQAKDEGVEAVVDLTTLDLGRDIRLLQELSLKSGVKVIACTGHWLDPSRSMGFRTIEELSQLFIKEIEVGIEGTDIKAGVIKAANDMEGITEFGAKLLHAAGYACKATGIPISTHTAARARTGELQAAIFEEEGVDTTRVCIGHSDDTDDIDYLAGLASRGYRIGMDRLPNGMPSPVSQPGRPDLETRVATIKKLIDMGYSDRILLSHDAPLGRANFPTERFEAMAARNPDGITFLGRRVLPRLRELGVGEDVIEQMTTINPRTFFAHE